MAFDIGAFRVNFPEFADTAKYSTEQIQFWADLAELQVLESVWKRAVDKGRALYVAHEITLAYQNEKTSKIGGVPGTFAGIASSKAVGGANISYDSITSSEKDAGYWNLTTYGKQFIRLSRIFGAGCIQL